MTEAEQRALEKRWGVLFQDGALFSSLTVAQNIEVPLKEFYRMPQRLMDEIAALKIGLAGLPEDAGAKFPAQLSGGMRKRAGLARALALDPEIVFLDEPTAGLDPIAAGEFDELIRDLKSSLGLTVFMVTHDLDTLFAICDRVAVLVDKKLRVGTLDQMLQDDHPWIHSYFHGPRGRARNRRRCRALDGPARRVLAAADRGLRRKSAKSERMDGDAGALRRGGRICAYRSSLPGLPRCCGSAAVEFRQELQPYYIFFKGSVAGLSRGSAVQYNGIPVGRVTDIRVDKDNVAQIQVTDRG